MYADEIFTGAALIAGTPALSDPYALPIAEASSRYNIPSWISAVIERESGGDAQAVSLNGAVGLMQLMPLTSAEMRAREGLGNNPYDARDNILAGTAYLRTLFERYGMPGAFAAHILCGREHGHV